jgi:hypothetical protein
LREHGDVEQLVVGPSGVRFALYCLFHPDGVRAVLASSRGGYSKGNRFYKQIARAFGWGLLTCEGELLGAPTLVVEKALHEAADDDGHREGPCGRLADDREPYIVFG